MARISRSVPPYQRPINMMFQSYALFPHMTVEQNIAFGLKQDKLPKAEIAERVAEMLALVHMQEFAKRKPHQLSGGQRQRVALARSLAKRPKLLLLDEPMGALDKKLRDRMQLEVVDILERVGVTCVMVTHDQEEAMTMAGRIAIMNRGKFVQIGEPEEIYEHPTTRYSAEFIGSVNVFEGLLKERQDDALILRSAGAAASAQGRPGCLGGGQRAGPRRAAAGEDHALRRAAGRWLQLCRGRSGAHCLPGRSLHLSRAAAQRADAQRPAAERPSLPQGEADLGRRSASVLGCRQLRSADGVVEPVRSNPYDPAF